MSKRDFNFPLATLIRQAGRLSGALADPIVGPPVIARLPAPFVPAFNTLFSKVGGAPAIKASQMGDTGTLTKGQNDAFHEMLRLMGSGRRSASLAFKGNHVVLREEFQVGISEPQGLGEEVKRAGLILAAANKYASALGGEGWVAADATALQSAIGTLSGTDLQQETSKAEGPGLTSISTVDANTLYHNCLSIQNAARLQYPSTQPGNETPRARYLIGEFPPQGHTPGGNTTGDTPAPPANPAPPAPPPAP